MKTYETKIRTFGFLGHPGEHLSLWLVSAAWTWPLIIGVRLSNIDKSKVNLLRAVVVSQPVPDREEVSKRRSRVGTCQDHLDPRFLKFDLTATKSPKSHIRQKIPRRQGSFAHYIVLHLNREVPEFLDPRVPHPSGP